MAAETGIIFAMEEDVALLFPDEFVYNITDETTFRSMNTDLMAAIDDYLGELVNNNPSEEEDEDEEAMEEITTQLDSDVVFVVDDEQYVKTRNRKVVDDIESGKTVWLKLIDPAEQTGKHRGIKNAIKGWISEKKRGAP